MPVFVDLDEDPHSMDAGDHSAYDHLKRQLRGPLLRAGNTHDARTVPTSESSTSIITATVENEEEDARPNPNLNGFSAALSCYPVVASLASNLDLNSLHDLSRTCRQFRANLLQYRKQLIAQSLRCSNEEVGKETKLADRFRASNAAWSSNGTHSFGGGRKTNGKVGPCARDKVGECRKCGTIVCRNCIEKPQTMGRSWNPINRHRRLCKACIRAPLEALIVPQHTGDDLYDDMSSTSSSPSSSPTRLYRVPTPCVEPHGSSKAFTAPAFEHSPCNCLEEVWLCHDCGRALQRADTDYKNGWTWRARYSTYLGVLGTGIGEGNEGVPCGRGRNCLAAKIVEQEVACDAEALRQLEEEAESTGRSWEGGGFEVQEIEGIGGGVKRKVKKLVLLGKRVQEHEDERSGVKKYLSREQEGKVRSWCSWCERVVLSSKDKQEQQGLE